MADEPAGIDAPEPARIRDAHVDHGYTEDDAHRADAHHVGGAHMEEHDAGHDDHVEGGHHEERLGPIDWARWGASVLGVAIAGVMTALFYLAVMPR